MTKWVDEVNLVSGERERISRASAFQPTLELSSKTGLPEVAITEPVRDNLTGKYLGREYLDVYPRGYLLPGESWAGPNIALKYAIFYFNEALSLEDPKDEITKIECARSSELLFLHACFGSLWEKTALSYRELARLYILNMAKGINWMAGDGQVAKETYPKLLKLTSTSKRAFYCLNRAIELGDAPAKVLLADLKLKGFGTKVDLKGAFDMYKDALFSLTSTNQLYFGLANLRLAECLECGIGTKINLDKAKEHYGRALKLLDIALDLGEDFFEFEFVSAKKGFERVKQETENGEVSFGYAYSFNKRRYCD